MLKIAVLIWMVLGTTLAGSLVTVVLVLPALADQSMRLIPIMAAVGAVLAIPLSVMIARRIQALTAPRH